jgi:aryl-alcohol dehydrogenase-like predicted oxidoreductase
MFTRTLGRSGIEVSALGMGCWAIGGPFTKLGEPVGWGTVDDAESLRAIERALALGVTFFDTADVYGCGHSERLLAKALAGRRDQVVLATKFGHVFDEGSKDIHDSDGSPAYVRACCEASRQRLGTDVLDLYQFHVNGYDLAKAEATRDTLEELVAEGKIRAYGWSTDDAERARFFAQGPHCAAAQQQLNILEGNLDVLAACEELGLASINRGPLCRGLLTGKFTRDSTLPANDVRHGWNFREGQQAAWLEKLAAIREVMTREGHTLAQAALGWLWARSPVTIPIPGFKTVAQVTENVGALAKGPLTPAQMREIADLLAA